VGHGIVASGKMAKLLDRHKAGSAHSLLGMQINKGCRRNIELGAA
jgi:hypothetical protein